MSIDLRFGPRTKEVDSSSAFDIRVRIVSPAHGLLADSVGELRVVHRRKSSLLGLTVNRKTFEDQAVVCSTLATPAAPSGPENLELQDCASDLFPADEFFRYWKRSVNEGVAVDLGVAVDPC